jgi:hypothetical protein
VVTRSTVEAGRNAVNKGDEMQIDLKKPGGLTPESVRDLLMSASDATNTQLCVSTDGIAFIRVASDQMEGLTFRIETWIQGTGNVGPGVARDSEWIEQIYKVLLNNWPTPEADIIDMY